VNNRSPEGPETSYPQVGAVIGNKAGNNKLYILASSNGSEALGQYIEGLKKGLKKSFSEGDLSLEIISPEILVELLASSDNFSKGNLLIVPVGELLSEDLRISLHNKSFPTFFYSAESFLTCVTGNQSPYLWNLGITTSMYAEGYLSYAYQRYGVLAKDLSFIIYSNTTDLSSHEATYMKETAQGLGFKVLASVSVDDREADLYKVLREIISFSPQVLLSSASEEGLSPFLQQSYKLGFGFEMAMMLTESASEEVLSTLGPISNKFIKPSTYIDSYDSDEMKMFKSEVGRPVTSSYYKGYLMNEIIQRILFQFKKEDQFINFSRSMMALDGNAISGPSGAVMIHSKARGLIQPLHLGEYKDGVFTYLQYLGDMSPSEHCE
jgi:hypothetical protein